MKIKYYLRGLGIGIVLTTLVLSIGSKAELTDDEIIERALKLGMEKPGQVTDNISGVLEGINKTTPAPADNIIKPDLNENDIDNNDIADNNVDEIELPIENNVSNGEMQDQPTEVIEEISFEIQNGMSSGSVAIMLQQLELIENAGEFNNYIVEQGKANVIRIGTYTITKGASQEEILETITSR